ncbi:MAG: thioredoxin family protein [Xanthomonadales bacterium]|nr:thioredoxin family protein [Xanthomonadales bacterium]
MVLKHTPDPELGSKAHDFDLLGTDGQRYTLGDVRGEKGTLIMFICNHCPYVKAIQERLVEDCLALEEMGVGCVAIMSNDPLDYPEDSYENMQRVALELNYPFPYLYDETQEVAKAYGAICTPDFFGYNSDLELQYRGRLDAAGREPSRGDLKRDLVSAFEEIVATGQGPEKQHPSMGCSIKWRE